MYEKDIARLKAQEKSLNDIVESGVVARDSPEFGKLRETWIALGHARRVIALQRPEPRFAAPHLKSLTKRVRKLEKRHGFPSHARSIVTAAGAYETPQEKIQRIAAIKEAYKHPSFTKCLDDEGHGCTHLDRFLAVGPQGHEQVLNPDDIVSFHNIDTGQVAVIAEDDRGREFMDFLYYFPDIGETTETVRMRAIRLMDGHVGSKALIVPEPLRFALREMFAAKNNVPYKICVSLAIRFPCGARHANIVTFNQMQRTYTRFEPHGCAKDAYDSEAIDMDFHALATRSDLPFLRDYTYITPSQYLPDKENDAIQLREEHNQTFFPTSTADPFVDATNVDNIATRGTCFMWCILYAYMHACHPLLGDRDVFDILNRGSANDLAILVRSFIAWNVYPGASFDDLRIPNVYQPSVARQGYTDFLSRRLTEILDKHSDDDSAELTSDIRRFVQDSLRDQNKVQEEREASAQNERERVLQKALPYRDKHRKRRDKWNELLNKFVHASAQYKIGHHAAFVNDKNNTDSIRGYVIAGLRYHKIYTDMERFLAETKAFNRNFKMRFVKPHRAERRRLFREFMQEGKQGWEVARHEWLQRENNLKNSFRDYLRQLNNFNTPDPLARKSAADTFLAAFSSAEEFLAQVKDVLPETVWQCGTLEMERYHTQILHSSTL